MIGVQKPRLLQTSGIRTTERRAPRSVVQQLWHAQWCVGSYPTDIWGVQSSLKARVQLLLVPGNPGCAAFYRQFMLQLFTAFGGAADVMAVSHVGHDSDNISKNTLWGLTHQVEHKVELLQQLQGPSRPPLIILAHSIGSYIMLKALHRLQSTDQLHTGAKLQGPSGIAKVFLLMPFLATHGSSWEQRLLAAAAAHHGPTLSAAAAWVQGSPGWVQEGVLQLMSPGAEPHAAESLRLALNQQGCRNNWHMAAQEFGELDGPVDWSLIEGLGSSRVAVVHNPDDTWFPQHTALRQALPEVEVHSHRGLSHAFCLSTEECKIMAQLVHASVTQQHPTLLTDAGPHSTACAVQRVHAKA